VLSGAWSAPAIGSQPCGSAADLPPAFEICRDQPPRLTAGWNLLWDNDAAQPICPAHPPVNLDGLAKKY